MILFLCFLFLVQAYESSSNPRAFLESEHCWTVALRVWTAPGLTITSLFSLTPQEVWPMAVGVSSLQPQEQRPSTAAPPARAPPSFPPAASCSRRHGYATACRTWCPQAGAACWRTSGTTATPTCSSETSLATSWSSARTSTAAGTRTRMSLTLKYTRQKKKNHISLNTVQQENIKGLTV